MIDNDDRVAFIVYIYSLIHREPSNGRCSLIESNKHANNVVLGNYTVDID